jgi:hypothetical protein
MTPRDRRALQIGGAVVVAALFLVIGAPAVWRKWATMRESLAEHRDLVSRAKAQVDGVAALDSTAAGVRSRFVALAPRLVAGGSEAEATATLGGVVTALADRSRLRLKRVDGESDSLRAGPLRRVVVGVELEGDWAAVTSFFRGLAGEPVALSLSAVDVRAQDPTSPGDRPEVLVIRTEVSGWYLVEEGR